MRLWRLLLMLAAVAAFTVGVGMVIDASRPVQQSSTIPTSPLEATAYFEDNVTTSSTTSTTEPPTTTAAPTTSAPRVEWPTSLEPCGGDLPPCEVKWRESRGDYSARNPSSEAACGAWQIITSTWNNFGGYASACDAPPAVQDEKARLLWAGGAGCGHWAACA